MPDDLLAHEAAELRFLVARYREERKLRNFAYSDALRKHLVAAGVIGLDKEPRWHPVFEETGHRVKRLRGRISVQGCATPSKRVSSAPSDARPASFEPAG